MSTLLLPQGFPTGVYVESPDTGKKRLYEFKDIMNEEFGSIDKWIVQNPDASKYEVLSMLEELAIRWATEDLFEKQDGSTYVLSPRELKNLEITYVL